MSAIKIKYFSSCLSGGPPNETNKCGGLKVGEVVSFTAQISVSACPKDPREWKQTFQIYPVGLDESLTVNLEMLCSCDCEDPNYFISHAPQCSNHGNYVCGICDCDQSYSGQKCECSL